ncbi:hypothetical protein [Paenibacillus alkalitolerans]|uniref:hypothetical protein n=1 Tax=Paenibacillus alkalitolerans TaxID=2799335 RepID=UPI0018F3207A|nr:hypothetical protein [Paenibacillus alkalitolerans]
MAERDNFQQKRPSKSFNEQKNMAEFAEEETTLRPGKAKEFPASLNNINKKLTD